MATRYLVTGADGFLGKHLLQLLCEHRIPTRAMLQEDLAQELPGDPERVFADLSDTESLRKATKGISHVVHLAARVHEMRESESKPLQAFREVNVEGTRRLLEASKENGVDAFLLMSSVKAMREKASEVQDEQTPCGPTTPYGLSKLEAEKLVAEWGRETKTRCVTLRLPMVYGPGAKGNVLSLLRMAARGRRLPFAGIGNKRSMVYVGNVVDAIVRTMEHPHAEGVFIVTDGRDYSTNALYEAMGRAAGMARPTYYCPVWGVRLLGCVGSLAGSLLRRPMPIDRAAASRLTEDLCFSSEKLRRELNIAPRFGLEDGMQETVKWFLRH